MKEYMNELGQRHRVDGPAVEYSDGTRSWLQNGLQHRVDGPAVEFPGGTVLWCLNGRDVTAEVLPWLKLQGFTVPLDERAQLLFILKFSAQ